MATLSVVICAHNRAALLDSILVSLHNQILAPDVIVVDDSDMLLMHTHGTTKYIWNRPDGLYHRVAKYNEAVAYVKTPFVVLLDDDTVPMGAEWAQGFVDALERASVVRGCFGSDCAFPGWFSTTNLGFSTLLTHQPFDPMYDGRYGYEDWDFGRTLDAMGVKVALGDERTAAQHLGEKFSGDREASQENERLFRAKWNL